METVMDNRMLEDFIVKQDIGSIARIPIPIDGNIYYLEIPLTTKDEYYVLCGGEYEII